VRISSERKYRYTDFSQEAVVEKKGKGGKWRAGK
jgi:hypothetical protein